MNRLTEDTRQQLLSKSRSSNEGGKSRYSRRVKSRVANTVKQYNSIDMNKLFKEDIITINISVNGETDNYTVRISFGGFLEVLRDEIKRGAGELNLRAIMRSLVICFNRDDVFISCSCPDWQYRFQYWATRNDINSGEPQDIPADITNPQDKRGSACKHVLLVLSNNSWLIKVASVINNYIKYAKNHMEKAYADIIYPAIYGKKYEEPVQLDIFDDDTLQSDEETIDTSNEEGRVSGQFKPGNPYRFQ